MQRHPFCFARIFEQNKKIQRKARPEQSEGNAQENTGAALSGGNFWEGALSGFVGGGIGAYIGGGGGAFAGGFSSGTLGSGLNGGDFGDILTGGLIGGAVAWGASQVQQRMNYNEYKKTGGKFTYKQFRKMSVASQRSFARGKEFGGWILNNGDVELWKPGQKAGITPTSKPSNATGFFHTHPNTGDTWLEPHSGADIGFNDNYARTASYVIGRQNVYIQQPYTNPTLLYNNHNFNPYLYWFGLQYK